jgi:chromate transporter
MEPKTAQTVQTASPLFANPPRVSLGQLFMRFLTIGSISFGGGIVAYLRQMLVEDTKWLTPDEFLATLEVGQTLPGTNSVNMSVLVGDYLLGRLGAALAFLGLVLPGSVLIFLLAVGTGAGRQNPIAHAALTAVTACAVGILSAITFKTGTKQFTRFPDILLLAATFVGMSLLKLPLLLLIVVMGGLGVYLYRPRAGTS